MISGKGRRLIDGLNETRLKAERETIALRLLIQVTETVGGGGSVLHVQKEK